MNRIRITEQPMSTWELATLFGQQDIRIPECQRLWSWTGKRGLKKMQYLIDSVMNGFPIPSIILNRTSHNARDVYDGRHRIETFFRYLSNEFKWDGRFYSELTDEEKRRFDDRQIPVTVTIQATNEQLAELFIRLNAGQPLTDSDKLWARRASPVVEATLRLVVSSDRLSAALGGADLRNRRDLANWVALVAGIVTNNAGNMTTSFVRLSELLDTEVNDESVASAVSALCEVLETANVLSPATNTEKKRLKKVGKFAAFFLAEYLEEPTADTKAKWIGVISRLRGNETDQRDMTAALTTTGAQNLTARKIEQVREQVNRLLSGGEVAHVETFEEEDSD
jgi:hypothetical protein